MQHDRADRPLEPLYTSTLTPLAFTPCVRIILPDVDCNFDTSDIGRVFTVPVPAPAPPLASRDALETSGGSIDRLWI